MKQTRFAGFCILPLLLALTASLSLGCKTDGDDAPDAGTDGGIDASMDGGTDAGPDASTNRCTFAPAAAGSATSFGTVPDPAVLGCGNHALSAGVVGAIALDTSIYGNSATCGSCIEVTGPAGTAIGQVAGFCSGCGAGALDLDSPLFLAVTGNPGDGRFDVSWRTVPCDSAGKMVFEFEGSNAFFLKLRVRNHRTPISKIELLSGTTYFTMTRTTDNAFTYSMSPFPGDGPYTFRLTDAFGDVVTQANVPLSATWTAPYAGTAQFSACTQ